MYDPVIRRRAFHSDWPHHAATALRPIAWIFIDVFAPKTFRTMIRISCALNRVAAVRTYEILYCTFENHWTVTVSDCTNEFPFRSVHFMVNFSGPELGPAFTFRVPSFPCARN